MGDVTPVQETCTGASDEDCDGEVNEEGPDCVCAPGATMSCYEGPPGTENVGLCAPGSTACAASGLEWGPCTGQVLPAPEDCTTQADEHCDGVDPMCAPGDHIWGLAFGGPFQQIGRRLASSPDGSILLGGTFTGTVDFGGSPLTPVAQSDVFVTRRDSFGNHLWSKSFGDFSAETIDGLGCDPANGVFVTGTFGGTVDLGGGPLTSAGYWDTYLLKLDSAGAHVWSKSFGDDGPWDDVRDLDVDPQGNVVIAGFFEGTMDFGGAPLQSTPPPPNIAGFDVFVAKLDPAGNHLWSKRFGDGEGQLAWHVAAGPFNETFVMGNFSGSIDFGGGPLTSIQGDDVFLARFDPVGNHVWSKRFGSAGFGNEWAQGLAVDHLGNVTIALQLSGTEDFGGGPLQSVGGDDMFLVRFNAAGFHVWSKVVSSSGSYASEIAVDSAGNVLVAGLLVTIDFGGGPLDAVGDGDVFVAKLGPQGTHLWSQRFGAAGSDRAHAVAAHVSDKVLVAGEFEFTVDFGGGPLASQGWSDAFLLALAP